LIDSSGRASALANIAYNTGMAISGAVKTGAETGPFPANLAAIGSGITAVLAGIAQAKNALSGGSVAAASFADRAPSVDINQTRQLAFVNPNLLGQFGTQAANEANQVSQFAQSVQGMPAPVVSVLEIAKVQNRVAVKVQEASLG